MSRAPADLRLACCRLRFALRHRFRRGGLRVCPRQFAGHCLPCAQQAAIIPHHCSRTLEKRLVRALVWRRSSLRPHTTRQYYRRLAKPLQPDPAGGSAGRQHRCGLVTAEALSSIVSSISSFGSRTLNTSVSTMLLGSTLNEYCTVLNSACTENSRRILTQVATEESADICALSPACRNPGLSDNVVRPRSTSKSGLNSGCFGTLDRAAAISFCSSGEGVHTFSMLTLTWGDGGCCAPVGIARAKANMWTKLFGDTAAFYQATEFEDEPLRLWSLLIAGKINSWRT